MTEPLADVAASWPLVSSEYVYDSGWVVKFRSDTIQVPGQPDHDFARVVVEDPGAVVVLPLDEDEQVVILRQYRHAVQKRMIQLPAGKLDKPGEDPLEAARRELREETGLAADDWTHLLTTFASPGITSETHAIFLARGLREVERDFEVQHEEAEMTVERVAYADLVEAVLDGRAADAPLAIAVLALESLRNRDRLAPVREHGES